ncbi:hypothetical protein B0H14DRAFT_3465482 [Mycena olivaceomarginata]|nr:hypothetical protein B0H14DRAFT_3465482 [Mycena olivaceomarginata]
MTLQYPHTSPALILTLHCPQKTSRWKISPTRGLWLPHRRRRRLLPHMPPMEAGRTLLLRAILLYVFTSILDIFTCVVPRNFRPTVTFFTANRRLTIVTTDAHAL